MVRGWVTKGQFQEFFKGDSVVNLAFQFRIRIDIYPVEFEDHSTGVKPFLQEQAFEQQQWWVCIGALITGTDLIVPHQNGVYAHPVNGFVNVGKAC